MQMIRSRFNGFTYSSLTLAVLLISFLFPRVGMAINPHPRLTLSPTMLSELRAKACIGQPAGCVVDPDYTKLKADADVLKTYPPQALTVVTMSNSNPITVTVNEDISVQGWCGNIGAGASMYMAGLTGAWAALNTVNTRVSLGGGFKSGTNTFTFPMDSTNWGPYPGGAVLFTNNSTCSKMLYYDYEGLGWYSWFKELGLMYQLTGDPSYATNALKLLDYINTLAPTGLIAPIALDSGFPARGAALGVAYAYDWFYPLLTAEQKAATIATLNAWYGFYQANINFGSIIFLGQGVGVSNYWGGYMLGFGASGLATQGDNPTADSMISFVRSQVDTYMAQAMAAPQPGWSPDGSDLCPYNHGTATCGGTYNGGHPAEGYNYGPNHIERILEYINMVKTATDEDMFTTTTYAPAMTLAFATNMIHSLFPNNWQAPNVGESADVIPMYLNLPAVIAYLRQGTTESGWMQYMINHAGTPPSPMAMYTGFQGALTGSIPIDHFIYGRSSIPEIDYTATEPTTYFSNGDGGIHWRSDWTKNAMQMTFVGSAFFLGGHHIRNASGVTVTRGSDYLVINAGHYAGTNGYSGSTPNSIVSDYSPVLHFDDAKTYMYGYNTQQNWGVWQAPTYKFTPVYTYAENDFTGAYDDKPGSGKNANNRTVRYNIRSVFQVGTSTIVYDRVMSKTTDNIKKLYWPISPITTPIPTLANNIASAAVGSSKVWIQPLLPAAPVTTLVKAPGGSSYIMQIGDSDTNTVTNFLTLIYADDIGGALPVANLLNSSGNVVAAQIAGQNPAVIVHASVVTDNGDGTYTPTPQVSASFTSTHDGTARYVVAGLKPAKYAILLNGVEVGRAVAESDGSLTFTGTSGAYSLTRAFTIVSQPSPLPATVIQIPYTATFSATDGTAPFTYTATGLPPGLTVDSVTGKLSGTPTQAGTYTITVTVTDATMQQASAGFNLTVMTNWPTLTITAATLPSGNVSLNYSFQWAATGGNGNYTWSVASGSLPAGLTLSSTGLITGVPLTAGISPVSIRVTSGDGQTAVVPCSILINSRPPSVYVTGASVSGALFK